MAISITHAFVDPSTDWTQADIDQAIADGFLPAGIVLADVVLPSHWNAALSTSMATGRLLGRSTAGAGEFEEIALGSGLVLSSGTVRASGFGVQSVNGQTGIVVLDTGDIAEATDANYVSDAQLVVIGNTSGTNTGDQNLFLTVAVSGQSNVVADSATDTLTLIAGGGMTITTNAGNDSITFAATGATLADGDYGDVTVSSSGSVITIDNDVVTYAKMQNVSATDKLLGRSSAGSGDVEEIACTSAGRSLIDDASYSGMRATLQLGTLATQSGTFSGTSSGTNTGDQTIQLTGDVTGSGTGTFAATIANDAVTYAKIQNVTSDRLLGRDTAGSGDTEEITVGGGLEFTGSGGIQRSLLTGDVTASAGSSTLTIANDAVTYAKMQNVSAGDKVLGRISGAGDIEEIACTSFGRSLIDDANGAAGLATLGALMFSTVAVSGQSDVVADSASDTLTFVAGANITLTTNVSNDSVTIASTGGATLGDGDYGDIVVTSSGTVMTVDNDVITYAKMQNVSATDKVLGRSSSGSGDVEEIACTSFGRAFIAKSSLRRTLWIPAAAIRPSSTGGCAALALSASSSGHPDISTLDFDASTAEYAQFWVGMPKGWNEGTIAAQFMWSHAATSANFGVVWGLQGVGISDDDTIDAAYGTAQVTTDTGGTTNDLYITAESSAITIGGTPQEGDMAAFRVYRDATNGSDTLAVDARLHGVRMYYTVNTLDDN